MQIVQTVFGVFHHFALARELRERGHLRRIYSSWPWARLRREGLPHELVRTFPYLHMLELAAARAPLDLSRIADEFGYRNALAFDAWTDRKLKAELRNGHVDALVGISGSSLRTGRRAQQAGGIFVCDRGSTHQRFQEQVVSEEYRLWGVDRPSTDERDTVREEAIYDIADAITVPSQASAKSFADMGVSPAKIHVIPYGVRLDSFRVTGEPPPDEFNVLFAGSASLRKGIPYLLQAFAALRHPRKRLRIAGAVQEDLRALLSRLPTEAVEFLGPVPKPRLIELMNSSHLLVLPSIEEGFGLVIPEAMACGCPVLCSENTGGGDMVTEGVDGFVVPVRDPASLADRMERLASDPNLARTMRVAAQRKVQSIGGWTQYGDRWEALLRQLTGAS